MHGGLLGWLCWSWLRALLITSQFSARNPPRTSQLPRSIFSTDPSEPKEPQACLWIWLVLPRCFFRQAAGRRRICIAWHRIAGGRELPVGFSKQRIGHRRVGINAPFVNPRLPKNRGRQACGRSAGPITHRPQDIPLTFSHARMTRRSTEHDHAENRTKLPAPS